MFSFLKKILLKLVPFLFIPLIFLFFNYERTSPLEYIEIEYRDPTSLLEIKAINDTLVSPILYNNTVNLKSLPLNKKKKKFIDLILPAILIAKHKLDQEKHLFEDILYRSERGEKLANLDSLFIKTLLLKYKAKGMKELKTRVNTHPVSIVLAQAALESGWGTSVFFSKANNAFGVWANVKTKNKIRAHAHRQGKPVYLRKYANLSASVEDYYLTISRVYAYTRFRAQRLKSDNPFYLIKFLNNYSELGERYSKRLRRVIRHNDLTKYDKYQIDPRYILKVRKEKILFSAFPD